MAYGANQKVAWNGPKYTVISGNSLACANMTNLIVKQLINGVSKDGLKEVLKKGAFVKKTFEKYVPPLGRPEWMRGMRAITFPFSKEIHSLFAYENLLDFSIVDAYDVKYRAQVGKKISSIIDYRTTAERIIKNYESIIWDSDDFDAVIVGHMDELSSVCKKDFMEEIICNCVRNNKKIYAFDDIRKYKNGISACNYRKNVGQNQIRYYSIEKQTLTSQIVWELSFMGRMGYFDKEYIKRKYGKIIEPYIGSFFKQMCLCGYANKVNGGICLSEKGKVYLHEVENAIREMFKIELL